MRSSSGSGSTAGWQPAKVFHGGFRNPGSMGLQVLMVTMETTSRRLYSSVPPSYRSDSRDFYCRDPFGNHGALLFTGNANGSRKSGCTCRHPSRTTGRKKNIRCLSQGPRSRLADVAFHLGVCASRPAPPPATAAFPAWATP